ncbi:MAG: RrF2 family transcriptional regulator [Bacteroidales bacterium]
MFYKETEYALRGLVYIQVQNYKGMRPGLAEIAKEIEAPAFYTAKILQKLAKQGFLLSMKGRGGGFYFDKDKAEIQLKDIISFTEGVNNVSGCCFGLKSCDENNPCPLHEQYKPIRESIDKLLTEESLQSLARKVYEGNHSMLDCLKT